VYSFVPREQIAENLVHLRDLFREISPSSEAGYRARERREILTRNLLSNLFRTKEHPTLQTVLDVAGAFSLTLDGAHRLFGYELDKVREYDLLLNAGRTRIVETYPFERDRLVDLPFRFGNDEAFAKTSTVQDLVQNWNADTPIRTLESGGWQEPNAFYVRVGTEDSLGSSLPPGAVALVMPIGEAERLRPNPRAIYLLQFGNGYRCSRCVVTRHKLILLTSGRKYTGPLEFSYPQTVRIAGRIRMFALGLPTPEYPLLRSLPLLGHGAPLILPWEHASMDGLFRTKHYRFRRSTQELLRTREAMESIFHTHLSDRTQRRYRRPTSSLPHVDGLIQLTIFHLARYTDVLRVQSLAHSDRGRYSLNTLLNIRHLQDLSGASRRLPLPVDPDRWTKLRSEFVEWPSILSMKNPELSSLGERIVRLPSGVAIQGLDPPIAAGSFVLLDKIQRVPEIQSEKTVGWGRRIYALSRGEDLLVGHLDRDGSKFVLLGGAQEHERSVALHQEELHALSSVSGVAVPV
jgi:hypothetical protein